MEKAGDSKSAMFHVKLDQFTQLPGTHEAGRRPWGLSVPVVFKS
jgi:hypothetical protein